MKKILTACILSILCFFTAQSALAATTASLSPASVSTAPGKTFAVTIRVDPKGTANYAEKIVLNYPADLLKVDSFSFSGNWTALTQPGYDSTDNTKGVLIKTAGYPSGITSATSFGTVTFSVKKAGSGSISIGSGSEAFEKDEQAPLTGNAVTVTSAAAAAPVVVPQTTPVPVQTQASQAQKSTPVATNVEEDQQTSEVSDPVPVSFTEESMENNQESAQNDVPPVVLQGNETEQPRPDQTGLMWFFVISVTIVINACCLIYWTLKMRS